MYVRDGVLRATRRSGKAARNRVGDVRRDGSRLRRNARLQGLRDDLRDLGDHCREQGVAATRSGPHG